jgi:hydroxymethylglutaryl-CoA reductase (NADPH)
VPISRERVLEIARRLGGDERLERLAARLDPTTAEQRPIAPEIPAAREMTAAGRDLRRAFLRERGVEIPHLAGESPQPDPESLQGHIELFIGMTQIPTALIGPLRVNGVHAHGDFYVPLATSEGALAASYHRGTRILSRAGGVSCLTTAEQVQRAPGFEFATLAEAGRFAVWVTGEFERLQTVAATRTRHGRLLDMDLHLEARTVYLILDYHTGDASGQNMVTVCSEAVCADILARTPVAPRYWFIESNMSGDKKATGLSFLNTRGRKVLADAILPRALVEEALRTTPERICDYWRMCFIGGMQSGSIGMSGHIANSLAAMFLACGQDVACVSEASVGITRFEITEGGDLRCGVSLPNLIVGTVGGGTRLPTATECLRILGCEGEGKAGRFAEICAGVALAGELSIAGAMCSGDFTSAHEKLGRRGPP